MKYDKPENANYVATVVALKNLYDLDGFDNVKGARIFGYQVLVGRDSDIVGVFFPAETQLSDEYCYENNLFREDSRTGNLNKEKGKSGYMEKNRRVKAIKFRGAESHGLFMPLDSLKYTGVDISELREGDEFDKLNGHEICRKYVIPKKVGRPQQMVDRGFVRADKKFMPEHIDTINFFKYADTISPESEAIVTQKLHGTSIRIAHTLVNRKPSIIERIASFFGAKIADVEYAYLYGSRKVIKDANNPKQNHFYDIDIWTREGRKLDGIIPKNYIVYGELVGWTPEGSPIQKGYTYDLETGTCRLYVYRIAVVNRDGFKTDLSWDQVIQFCEENGLHTVPELYRCPMKNLTSNDCERVRALMDRRYFDDGMMGVVPLSDADTVDEGVCIRVEGLLPRIYKAKAPKFLEHETKILDAGDEDLETVGNG